MKPYASLKTVLAELLPLHRTLASEGQDRALEIVGSYMPAGAGYSVETYAPLKPVWTWQVPERYLVHEAYLEVEDGPRVLDFHDNPLHLVSYSLSVDRRLSFEELEPHLYSNAQRPQAIPWVFKYYERDWGFCLSREAQDALPRDRRYHAVIRTEFVTDPAQGFRVATAVVHPDGGPVPEAGEFLVQAHTCHPMQANDDAAGVVSAIELAHLLAERPLPPGSMSVRFWFGPETIGTIAWLAHNEDLIPALRGGIFLEMTGNRGPLAWHHSRQHDHLLDRIAAQIMQAEKHPGRDFASAPANDERVVNGPGVNVPCISLNRWPYDEYHTSDDNLDIIDEGMLVEAAHSAEEIVRIFASNYIPRRNFRGPVFLSGSGLWVDWRENWALNRAIEKIMTCFEGDLSVFDIAAQVGLDYWMVRDYVEKFRLKGLVDRLPIPSEAQTA